MDLNKYNINDYTLFFDQIFDDKIQKKDVKDFLLSINKANMPISAFLGAISSLRKRMTHINAPKNALDVCGTGGDKLNTLNISTAVSFVVAGCGVCIAKHGNKAISSNSGSADIFQEIGIKFTQDKNLIEESFRKNNLCFLYAPLFHDSLKIIKEVRIEIDQATIFNFLGPLLNPANVNYQIIGTSSHETMKKMAQIICQNQIELNQESQIYLVHGFDMMDEITLCDNSYLTICKNGKIIKESVINPEDIGFKKIKLEKIQGKDPKYNAKKLIDLLNGKKSPYRDIVIINAAYALMAVKKVNNISEAINLCHKSIDNKLALQKLNNYLKITSAKSYY